MRPLRLLFACLATIALTLTSPATARGDTGTIATITCSDGSFMSAVVTPSALLQLTQDVQSLVGCTLSTDPPPTPTGGSWTVFDYNPSDQALAPRVSSASLPASSDCSASSTTSSTCTVDFMFKPSVYTALLTTSADGMTGDLSASTLTASGTVGPADSVGLFQTQRRGGDCINNVPAAFRFYFTSARASGPSDPAPGQPVGPGGTPPRGFYTQFWWSNPINAQLLSGTQGWTMPPTVVADSSSWSDWDGKSAADPLVNGDFMVAIHHVQSIGFSYGGECFFETGVLWTGTTAEPFHVNNFTVSPPPLQ